MSSQMSSQRAPTIDLVALRPGALAALVIEVSAAGWSLAILAITLLLLGRRISGALVAPSDAVALLTVLVASVMSLLAGHLGRGTSRATRLLLGTASCAPMGLAATVTFTSSGWPIWLILWSVAAVPLVGAAFPLPTRPSPRRMPPGTPMARRQKRETATSGANVPVEAAFATSGEHCDVAPQNTLQEIRRGPNAEGVDTLVGRLRVRMAAGARSGRAHVVFCPPFAGTPTVTLEPGDPLPARVRVAQVLPQGVRFELKSASGGSDDADVEIRFRVCGEHAPNDS
ncbi:MAG: hypothetical protein KDA63_02475 [Planctomycetales bacterium]|nr:hypothetical protein [Planctomycetales bacterium]